MRNKENKQKKQKNTENSKLRRVFSVQEMKQNKYTAAVYIVLRLIIIVIAVISLILGNLENIFTCILTLVLMLVPSFLENRLKMELPTVLEVIIIIFIFVANILGEIGAYYEKIHMLDTILHTLNGFICAGVGFGLIDILNQHDRIKMHLSPLFVCLFSFCFSMTAGTVWEFFEFGVDMLLGKDMQKDTVITTINSVLLSGGSSGDVTTISGITDTFVNGERLNIDGYLDIGLIDTMKDLIVNFIGAVVFNVAGYFYLINRGKKAGFITHFIPSRRRKNLSDDTSENIDKTKNHNS